MEEDDFGGDVVMMGDEDSGEEDDEDDHDEENGDSIECKEKLMRGLTKKIKKNYLYDFFEYIMACVKNSG